MRNLGLSLVLAVSLTSAFIPLLNVAPAAETLNQGQSYYTCPMHPEVHSDAPGECPICHMKLKKVSPEESSNAAAQASKRNRRIKFYRNPMNPSITSKVPMKDEMGMDYVPVYEDDARSATEPIPGRAPVRLAEGQLSLSGASLVQVSRQDIEAVISVGGRALSGGRVSLQVPEHDIPEVKTGLEVSLESPSAGAALLSGKVVSLDSILDPMTRSLRVDVQLQGGAPGLRPESSVVGAIRLKRAHVLAVPASAVLYLGEQPYVYVAERERAVLTPRRVKLGLKGTHETEVVEGLAEGERISSGPNFLIDSESRIQAAHD